MRESCERECPNDAILKGKRDAIPAGGSTIDGSTRDEK